jgi:hypothetical protein
MSSHFWATDDSLANRKSGRWTAGDVMDAFYTVECTEESRKWLGFTTHDGHYQIKVMPQGSVNAAMCWAEAINKCFNDMTDVKDDLLVYQDDVFVCANNLTKHIALMN